MNVVRCIDPKEHHLTIAQGYANGKITGRTKDKILTTRLGGLIARDMLSAGCGEKVNALESNEHDGLWNNI